MSEHRKLFKSAGVVSLFTLVSRILGFMRDIIIARVFGTSLAAQAFVVAFRIPNTLRQLIGEGAANAAIIPVLSEYLRNDKDEKEFWHLANFLLNFLLVTLAVITILGTIFSGLMVRIMAFGFLDDPVKLELTIRLTRIMFSFIFFIGLASYAMGILNSLKHFAAPAAGSCLLNITMISFGLWGCGRFSEPIVGMAIAVLIGGFLQFAVNIPVLLRDKFKYSFTLDFKHPAIKRIGVLFLPRLVGSSIYQLNIFADTMFASFGNIVGETAVAVLYFANHLIQFPTALFGNAMATACLPTMSRLAVANEINKLKETLIMVLRSLVILIIPSTIGLFVLAKPIIKVLFEGGKFDSTATALTSGVLSMYAIGLFAYSAARVISSCFYALKDTMTPVKITGACLIANIVFNYILMWPMKAQGLALATSLSSLINFFALIFCLKKKIGPLGFRKVVKLFYPVSVISVIMGLASICCYKYFESFFKEGICLLIAMIVAIIIFVVLGICFGIFKGFRLRYEIT
ncbi:MAG: murein biosynthesis integral membrane protein MurJ [Candidatus Omnitrophica bacterium]|nr:murein biosynthesis integral membrane protein MurJ [Candidatus Omnitrophota bacterium]